MAAPSHRRAPGSSRGFPAQIRQLRPAEVVIVDDDPVARALVQHSLSSESKIRFVGEASDAEQALNLVRELRPDVVLMDVRMPRTDGIEATRRVKKASPETEVIALTAVEDSNIVRLLVRAGASGYIVKGEDPDEIIRAVLAAAAGEALLSPRVAKTVLQEVVDLYRQERSRADELESTIRSVAHALTTAIEARDATTSDHSVRVVAMSLEVLRRLDPDAAADPMTEYGFLLHDVGKIAIPDAILLKPGALTEEEWRTMRQHPLTGAQLIETIEPLRGTVASTIARHHHERWDGTGYPYGLRGEQITTACRAFAVVDAFDAMTSDRPYKKAISLSDALAELRRCSGTQFDPEAVAIFREIFAEGVHY